MLTGVTVSVALYLASSILAPLALALFAIAIVWPIILATLATTFIVTAAGCF
jgi:hypothetical protein